MPKDELLSVSYIHAYGRFFQNQKELKAAWGRLCPALAAWWAVSASSARGQQGLAIWLKQALASSDF